MHARQEKKLEDFINSIINKDSICIGYPVNTDFDYSFLDPLFQFPINNVGDPMIGGNYRLSSFELERDVIDFFAQQFRADQKDYWGYVTNGGSEGNLYGLYMAREMHPKGMVYYSESTHYSVHKNIHLLNMPAIAIRSQANGEIDYGDLEHSIRMNRHFPAIILANIGTTMTESRDDLQKINEVLRRNAINNKYLHCDAALSGSYAAFIEPRPHYDFADGADSIAVSGHKFIGSPIPCGVVIVKKRNRDRIARAISYIDSMDTTITGSRNGHTPLILYYAIHQLGVQGLKERYLKCLSTADYALSQLKEAGISVWKNEGSITIVLPTPDLWIKKKWQLASQDGQSHIICMPGVTRAIIDDFIEDIKSMNKSALNVTVND